MADVAAAERAFDELSEWLAKQLEESRGTIGETAILEEAVRRYGAARKLAGSAPYDGAVAFLGESGVGLEKKRKPSFQRVPNVTAEETTRWGELAAEHTRRLASAG